MAVSNRILIVTSDKILKEELLAAVASVDQSAPAPTVVETWQRALEAVRNRPPDLVVVELGGNLGELRSFAEEVRNNAPNTIIAAVFRPDAISGDASESTLLIDALRAGVSDFLRRPVSSAELTELILRNQRDENEKRHAAGRVISFISNKGGVGKSTLAVNTAAGLAIRHPGRVLLIDASLQMGVAAAMLNLQPQYTLSDVALEHERLDETMIRQMATAHSCGLHILAAPHDALAAAKVDDEVISRVITLARRVYDYVIVDTFPLFDRVVVTVLDFSECAYVVVENVVPTVLGAAQMLEVLDNIGFSREKRRIVLNKMTSVVGGLTASDVASRLNEEIAYALPYDTRVISAANLGDPYIIQSAGWWRLFNPLASGMRSLVTELDSSPPINGQASFAGTGDAMHHSRDAAPIDGGNDV